MSKPPTKLIVSWFFSPVIANNAWLFSIICSTIFLSSQRGDLLVRQPHTMLRRLNSLQGIYPLLLWLILCGLQVSERSPIASISYKSDSWRSSTIPSPWPKSVLHVKVVNDGASSACNSRSFAKVWLEASAFELNSNLSPSLIQSRNLQLLK